MADATTYSDLLSMYSVNYYLSLSASSLMVKMKQKSQLVNRKNSNLM
jgi:hypothetical protein